MTERGEGLTRAPRRYTLGEQAQLMRRREYALTEWPSLDESGRSALTTWRRPHAAMTNEDAQHTFRVLASVLVLLGVPEALPRNAASPARYKRPPARR